MGTEARQARAARREERRAERPERYWIGTRWMDGRWGRGDGKANLLAAALEDCDRSGQAADGEVMGLTPHLGTIGHQFRGKVAAVRERAEREISDAVSELTAVAARIPVAQLRLTAAEAALDAFGTTAPPDRLTRRNAVETHRSTDQIRARNQGEWDAERGQLVAKLDSAGAELTSLKQRWTQLDGVISARRELAGRRAVKLQEHALRRNRYYERRLVRRHSDGSRLVTLLNISRPQLPDWVEQYRTERSTPPWHEPAETGGGHTGSPIAS